MCTKQSIFQRPLWVVVFALTAAIAWGWAFPLIKVGFSAFGITADMTGSKMLFAGIRFAIAGLIVLSVARSSGRSFQTSRRIDWRFILAFAIEERIGSRRADGKAASKTFFRTLFFIPVVTSVTVVAIIFSKIFQPYQGIIGHYLHAWFGMSPTINVLGNKDVALYGIMLANIWEWTGWSMIMYVGGISQIPDDIKEAARIDGANTWQEIWHVYLPSLASVHKSLLMLGIIGSLQTYALINVMTGGGPNHASEMPGTYIFMKGFTENQMGYACAISVSILLLALVLTIIQVKFLGSGDFMKKGE